ncbi:MAG: hypothetical protein II979_01890 [Clostridia bacterium]|nr:hypothetical protein [Clostridia bacterium]
MDGDIAGMLRQVMENPQFGNMMEAVKTQMGGGDGTADPAKIMEKLPQMMAVLGPVMQGMLQETGGESSETVSGDRKESGGEEQVPPELSEIPEPEKGEKERGDSGRNPGMLLFRPDSREKRNRLLAALKPYLSPARCAMVDRAMSAMQLGEILGTMAPTGKQEG